MLKLPPPLQPWMSLQWTVIISIAVFEWISSSPKEQCIIHIQLRLQILQERKKGFRSMIERSLSKSIKSNQLQGVSYVFGRFYEAVLRSLSDLKYFFSILVKISCKYLKKSIKYFFWHQAWPHNDLLLLKSKVKLLHHTYLWPPILWHNKAMGKGKIEAMATKFSEKFAIIMLKKYRKICRGGLTHLDTAPIIQIHMRHPVQ